MQSKHVSLSRKAHWPERHVVSTPDPKDCALQFEVRARWCSRETRVACMCALLPMASTLASPACLFPSPSPPPTSTAQLYQIEEDSVPFSNDDQPTQSNLLTTSAESTFDIFDADQPGAKKKKSKTKRVSKAIVKRLKRVRDKANKMARPSRDLSSSSESSSMYGSTLSLAMTESAAGARLVARGFLDMGTITKPGQWVRLRSARRNTLRWRGRYTFSSMYWRAGCLAVMWQTKHLTSFLIPVRALPES